MWGRVLFAFVCLIIAAGVVLPIYPFEVRTASSPAADPILLVAGSGATGCEDCPVTDAGAANCQSDCPCSHVLRAATDAIKDSVRLSVLLLIRPLPAHTPDAPQPLLSKLPAI